MELEDFHFDPEVQDIAELHIEKTVSMEEREAKKLLKRYREIRHELRDRLDTLSGDSFSAQQLRGTLLQVDLAIVEMSKSLKESMDDASTVAAEAGIGDLVAELNKFNKKFGGAIVPININAVEVGLDTKNFLINRYESSIDSYSELIRQRITQGITNAMIEQVSLSETIRRLGQFMQGEEWRLQMIARTELHNVYNLGKLNGMRDIVESDIPDLKKTLYHPMDKRTGNDSKHVAVLDLVVPIDQPFEYYWPPSGPKRELRRYMVPPDRPNDRSILIPFRESWVS
jgi:hypothetical protein